MAPLAVIVSASSQALIQTLVDTYGFSTAELPIITAVEQNASPSSTSEAEKASAESDDATQNLLNKETMTAEVESQAQKITDTKALIAWLCRSNEYPLHLKEEERKKAEVLLEELRAALLQDLFLSLPGDSPHSSKSKKETTIWDHVKLGLLATAGILLAACEGFDGITTMLGMFSLSAFGVLIAGIVFSVLSIAVFCAFDLVQLSDSLKVSLADGPKLLDAYISQLEEIKSIRTRLASYVLTQLSEEDLQNMQSMLVMLEKRLIVLKKASEQFDEALNSSTMTWVKNIFAAASGIIFFGAGFFAGQSVAIFLFSFAMTGVTAAFWPVILISAIIGLASLSLYWFSDQLGLKQLISSWFGLSEAGNLCDSPMLQEETRLLNTLQSQVADALETKNKKTADFSGKTPQYSPTAEKSAGLDSVSAAALGKEGAGFFGKTPVTSPDPIYTPQAGFPGF